MFRAGIFFVALILISCGQHTKESSPRGGGDQSNENRKGEDNKQSGGITSAGDLLSPVIASGEVIFKSDVNRTSTHDFYFATDSHAVVRLVHHLDQDSNYHIIKEINFSHLSGLPFSFSITEDSETGPTDELFSKKGNFAVQVKVYSHAGNELRAGDLVNEEKIVITGPTNDLNVLVVDVEQCGVDSVHTECSTHK